jgi:hypothetical protein
VVDLGRALVTLGVVLVVLGLLVSLGARLPGVSWLGRLPGDIYIERPGLRIYLPLGTSVVASVALTLIVFLVRHVLRR